MYSVEMRDRGRYMAAVGWRGGRALPGVYASILVPELAHETAQQCGEVRVKCFLRGRDACCFWLQFMLVQIGLPFPIVGR